MNGIWHPDEDIRTSKDYKNLPRIRAQRKIAKVKSDANKYFTFDMSNRGGMIKRGIVGLGPDHPEELQLTRRMKAHPIREKRTLTEEQKRAKAEILFEARKKRSAG